MYHTPNSPWYDRTQIDTSKGERWFCSEEEAKGAGWRAPEKAQPKPTSTSALDNKPKPCETEVNINTADIEELETLPGIGEVKAQSIVDYRREYGIFGSVEQLVEVRGIGEKTLDKVRNCVRMN